VNEIVDYVIKSGVNSFDTAQAYGSAEEVLGEAIKNNDNFIVSKITSETFRDKVNINIEKSLKNLKTKKLFALLLHDSKILKIWNNKDKEKVLNLKQSNKISFFGVSTYSEREFDLAINNSCIDIIQIPFNLFDQRAISKEWFKKAKKANKFIYIRSIYLQGLLLMESKNVLEKMPRAFSYIEKLEKICKDYKISRNKLALSFVENIAKESSILFGCDNLNQAEENINNFNNISRLKKSQIEEIIALFSTVPENIYNPCKW